MRDPRHDILFEPIAIGPVTAPNRFYQVPHCNGMGRTFPNAMIAMRETKAEGGWGIVATEQCDFHVTSDILPYTETNLFDEGDELYLGRMVEGVHRHGSLASIELAHSGQDSGNLYSREVPIGPAHRPVSASRHPIQARAMDRADIADYRRWHRRAALRSRDMGFDMVVVYAGHNNTVPGQFFYKRHNDRSDEYGGSLENRLRLLRALIEDTKDAVGDTMAVVVRMAVDELMGPDGLEWQNEGREAIEMLAELPDLWDLTIGNWANDSQTSRFAAEGYQEDYVSFVKKVTSKPVAIVGRYTSPDAMVSAIRRGVTDLIGAARPSIADPFLPNKIAEGRSDDIRECIGCNICAAWNNLSAPSRCTQNPTFGEEWRKGWHPERVAPAAAQSHILIVGAGPAGLEAARTAGLAGYRVTLAEASDSLGGRVSREARLPGLSEWARVRDYRTGQIAQMANVDVFQASRLDAAHILEMGAEHVALATGSTWRRDGMGLTLRSPVPVTTGSRPLTPDDIMAGQRTPDGPVVIFDDDGYYMASVLAELMAAEGRETWLATPATVIAPWTEYTLEQQAIEERLATHGVTMLVRHTLLSFGDGEAVFRDGLARRDRRIACAGVISVTARLPEDDLWLALNGSAELEKAGIRSLKRIGDCFGPGLIAAAVYQGHRYVRELDAPIDPDGVPFRRERQVIEAS
ncbi:MAG: NAD(P)-binding protein [Rhodospirillaceae bacterium]|jgi:dimethylamine/trimethylamine dehydrogenase|nr:NAD(P)-binding protein [Rhodospirillaceae bacterium]MBT6203062.1 NAD(P)-binding protein [Rhodospirillaceae bacterium]MBT7648792.1 NAD(P)-binding protein [Rhodospirillaceae bacterium]